MTPIAARLFAAASLMMGGLPCQQLSLSQDSLAPSRFVPSPRQVVAQQGTFSLSNAVVIHVPDAQLAPHARVLRDELALMTGLRLRIAKDAVAADTPTIELQLRPTSDALDAAGLASERYELRISPKQIVASSGAIVGVTWATSTLLQSLAVDEQNASVPCGTIRDEPLAPYRALMIDVARSPHSLDTLRGAVRLARLYKIRFLQLHLTDNEHFTFPFAPVTDNLKNNSVFDRAALAEFVTYAQAHGITLIPEVDLPGHSRRLIASGYLDDAESDADVASEKHWPKLRALLDDVIGFFPTSPYFHIGGDESGAGRSLVPFLARVNQHVRSRGKRLIVWEGFHGAPTEQLPATGDDRILVAAWESSYNAPWDLLSAGYELINASWRPLYVVGGDNRIHPGSSAGRRWSPEELCAWHKDRFMHWEPGRPVFEDRGPEDADRDDGIWDIPKAEWRSLVLGGQVSVWEQRESSVLRDLRYRMPVVAERLWSGTAANEQSLMPRVRAVDERVWGLVQPVNATFEGGAAGPINRIAHHYVGDEVHVALRNRTRAQGEIRWATSKLDGNWNWIDFRKPPVPSNTSQNVTISGCGALRVGLFAPDGSQIGAQTWARCINWPMRVAVTDYAIGRRVPKPGSGIGGGRIPNFDDLAADRITAQYQLPMLRGPLTHTNVRGQRFAATLIAPRSGQLELTMKTQSGHATLWFDANGDGKFADSERIIPETPNTEQRLRAPVTLEAGKHYAIRIDHVATVPRPVVIVTLDEPDAERPQEITQFLKPL